MHEEVSIATAVMNSGKNNSVGLKIPLKSNWNMELFINLCTSRSDREVAQYLLYGWPINRQPGPLTWTYRNHPSAERHPHQVTKYIEKELRLGTIMGPYATSPFPLQQTGISPMSTRSKKNSLSRRILVDLSWPPDGDLVNSRIPKDTYMDCPITLVYLTVDSICKQAFKVGSIAMGYHKDMSRAFKHILTDPNCWSTMGIWWLQAVFFEKSEVMGCRSALMACQKTTNCIRHFMANINYVIFNYIDDFMSVDHPNNIHKSYQTLGNLLRDLGVQEALEKAVPPTTVIEFLGILFDLLRQLLILPQDKIRDIHDCLCTWRSKQSATKKEMQQLAGKLQFAAICI